MVFSLGLVLLSGGLILSSGSITSGSLPRGSNADVVIDADGALGLEVADSVENTGRKTLVTVTNNGVASSIDVTVALQNGSKGTLYARDKSGDSVSFSLTSGTNQDVNIEVDGCPDTIAFDVTAASTGIDISAPDRKTSVTCSGGP